MICYVCIYIYIYIICMYTHNTCVYIYIYMCTPMSIISTYLSIGISPEGRALAKPNVYNNVLY